MTELTIRPARPADAGRLRRLAALDSATVPAGDLLVGELDGQVQAALSRGSRRAIANPFLRTAELVEALTAADAHHRAPTAYRRGHGALRLA